MTARLMVRLEQLRVGESSDIRAPSHSANSRRIAFVQRQELEHISHAGIRKPHATNNRIERLNGTLRERVKVQRGWKTIETPLAEGQRIQYNFVKPHMALENQTPVERAGVGIEAKNKWLAMLTEAITRDATEGEKHP